MKFMDDDFILNDVLILMLNLMNVIQFNLVCPYNKIIIIKLNQFSFQVVAAKTKTKDIICMQILKFFVVNKKKHESFTINKFILWIKYLW